MRQRRRSGSGGDPGRTQVQAYALLLLPIPETPTEMPAPRKGPAFLSSAPPFYLRSLLIPPAKLLPSEPFAACNYIYFSSLLNYHLSHLADSLPRTRVCFATPGVQV